MNQDSQNYDLAGKVIGCAMEVHRELGFGFNENVYKNSLAIELRLQGFIVEVEKKITVIYKGETVGDFSTDLLVDHKLILELKAVQNLCAAHEQQLVNYLQATGLKEGLIINFGSERLQFKKKFRDYKNTNSSPPKLQP